MVTAGVTLTPFEQILRWLVVVVGIGILLEFVWAAAFVPETRRQRTFNVVKISSSIIIFGIVLNYLLRTPVVMPGALFYLSAYAAMIAEIATLAVRRSRARRVLRDEKRAAELTICPHCGARLK